MSKVAIIMGSDSDWPKLEPGYQLLQSFGIETQVLVASAHRTPDVVEQFARGAKEKGIDIIIAGAGAAAHLAGVVAAFTTLPVIGVPISGSALKGIDALLSMVQMPPGIPVATIAIDCGKNAALYAIAILALNNPDIDRQLVEFRQKQAEQVAAKNHKLNQQLSSH